MVWSERDGAFPFPRKGDDSPYENCYETFWHVRLTRTSSWLKTSPCPGIAGHPGCFHRGVAWVMGLANERVFNTLGITIRHLILSDTVRWSRDISVTGHKQWLYHHSVIIFVVCLFRKFFKHVLILIVHFQLIY